MVMVVLFQRQTADMCRCVQMGELSDLLMVWSLLLAVEVIQSIMQVCCAGMAHCLDEAGSREML